jgi:chromosome segregation ATPase
MDRNPDIHRDCVSRADYEALREELADARQTHEEAADLERDIRQELESDIERRDADNSRLKGRIASLEEQVESLQIKIRSTLEERGSLNSRVESLKLSEQKLKRRSVSLEQDCEELETNIRIKESSTSVLEERYAAAIEENAYLLARAEEAEERVQRLKDQNRELEEDIAALSLLARKPKNANRGLEEDAGGLSTRDSNVKLGKEVVSASTLVTSDSHSSLSAFTPSTNTAPPSTNFLKMSDHDLKFFIKYRETELAQSERDLETLRKLLRSRSEKKLNRLQAAFSPSSPRKPVGGSSSSSSSSGGIGRRISRLFQRDPN